MLRAAKRRALVVDLSQPQGTEKGLGTPPPPDLVAGADARLAPDRNSRPR